MKRIRVYGVLVTAQLLVTLPVSAQSGFDVYVEASLPGVLKPPLEAAGLQTQLERRARALLRSRLPFWSFDERKPSAYLRILFSVNDQNVSESLLIVELKRSRREALRDASWDTALFKDRRQHTVPWKQGWEDALNDALPRLLQEHEPGIRATLKRYPVSQAFEFPAAARSSTGRFGVLPIDWQFAQRGDPIRQMFLINADSATDPALVKMYAEGTGRPRAYSVKSGNATGVEIRLCNAQLATSPVLDRVHAGTVYWDEQGACRVAGLPESP